MNETHPHEIRVSSPPARPTVIFDGGCAFCRRWVERWKGLTGNRAVYIAYQDSPPKLRELPPENFRHAIHLIEPDGRATRGARAVAAVLAIAGRRWPLALYDDMPWLSGACEAAYRLVAAHRNVFNVLDLALFGRNTLPVTHQATRRWFLRGLSLIYIFAFVSLWGQIEGLVGSRGILPIAPQLRGLATGVGGTPYFQMPTIFWINASDGMLVGVCAAGVALSVMLTLRLAPTFAAFGAWFCYLSLSIAGQAFLAFQWDALLLEAGFLAIFLAPLQRMPRRDREPPASRIILWLYRWLLFRLMFTAGLVKILGDDPNWLNLNALHFHYWTQPLPTWIAWYMNQLPDWFERLSVGFTLYVELIVPIFFFAPRQLRRWAFGFTVLFQVLILLTGNFGFFNLLAIVLCVLLLDDTFWPFRKLRRRERSHAQATRRIATHDASDIAETARRMLPHRSVDPSKSPSDILMPWIHGCRIPFALAIIFFTSVEALRRIGHAGWIPTGVMDMTNSCAAFRSTNPYGLFEEMTTRRPEIIVEGSNDGVVWKAYEFKWKPGNVYRRPAFCTPDMPRLDWQMWFAGLELERQEMPRWMFPFLRRLLQGSPQVAGLMEKSPFGDHPPTYLRASLYFYRFTTRQEAKADGAWWRRYSPGISTGAVMLGPRGELTPTTVP